MNWWQNFGAIAGGTIGLFVVALLIAWVWARVEARLGALWSGVAILVGIAVIGGAIGASFLT